MGDPEGDPTNIIIQGMLPNFVSCVSNMFKIIPPFTLQNGPVYINGVALSDGHNVL
jgi:hypothetical protein